MGREFGPKWYNKVYGRIGDRERHDSWTEIYRKIISFLPRDRNVKILDVGCGSGEIAEKIYENRYKNYTGIDFSAVAIKQAKARVPQFEFLCVDAFSTEVALLLKSNDVVLMLDFLEHVKDDLKLIQRIPATKQVVFMVPAFDYASHVRYFVDFRSVVDRYGGLLEFKDVVRKMNLEDTDKVSQFLINSIRK